MNRKQLIILILALVILGGAGLVLRKRDQQSWDTTGSKLGEKVLPNFQVNNVSAIHIKGDKDLDLVKKNDRWCVQERNDYPANYSQITELLFKMGDLKVAQSEPISPPDLGRMDLADPGTGPEAATLVEFKDAQGKTLESVLLGKKHTRKADRPSPYGDGEFPDGRYILLKSDPSDLLTVSDPLNSVQDKPADWLNKDFFKVEKPKSIALVSTNAADSWTLTRESENSPWVLSNVKTNEVLDTNKVSSLAGTLSYPSFVDIAADQAPAKTGLDKPTTVTITTFDGFTYTLKIGNKTPENDYDVSVDVAAEFPKETDWTGGKAEKPEDKAKIDKVYQDKYKPLQDKLKQEKELNGWTYVVNGWLIDPLIRTRGQLMVDKKDEKKEADSSSAAMPDKADSSSVFPAGNGGSQ